MTIKDLQQIKDRLFRIKYPKTIFILPNGKEATYDNIVKYYRKYKAPNA